MPQIRFFLRVQRNKFPIKQETSFYKTRSFIDWVNLGCTGGAELNLKNKKYFSLQRGKGFEGKGMAGTKLGIMRMM